MSDYFIKKDYIPNLLAKTYECENFTYWTSDFLETANDYQYHVYEHCCEYIKEHKCDSLLEIGPGTSQKSAQFLAPYIKRLTLIDQPSVETFVKKLLPQAEFITTDLENPSIRLNIKYDIVMMADVVEHLINPAPCLTLIKTR